MSYKLDWTTLNEEIANELALSMPTRTWSGPCIYNTSWFVERYGKIVVSEISGFPNGTIPAGAGTSTEIIPVGYRPTRTEVGVFRSSQNGQNIGIGRIYTDGKFGWWLPLNTTTEAEITFRITYITHDNWPS